MSNQVNIHKPTKPFIPLAVNQNGRKPCQPLPVSTPPTISIVRRSRRGVAIK